MAPRGAVCATIMATTEMVPTVGLPPDKGLGMDVTSYMRDLGRQARAASRVLAAAGSHAKDDALAAMARALDADRDALTAANQQDLAAARDSGLDAAQLDRLELTPARIDAMIEGLR